MTYIALLKHSITHMTHTSDLYYDLYPQYISRVLSFVFDSLNLGITSLLLSSEHCNICHPQTLRSIQLRAPLTSEQKSSTIEDLYIQILDLFIIMRVLWNP